KVTLTIEIHGLAKARIDGAYVALFDAGVVMKNAKEMRDVILHGSGASAGQQLWIAPGPFPHFDVDAGPRSVCTIPINGNMSDPQLLARLCGKGGDQLAAYCAPVVVKLDPSKQTFVQEVPPMKPLPSQ